MSGFQPTVTTYVSGSRTLPGEAYTRPELLDEERERIHARMWNCVGRASSLPRSGDYMLRTIAGESIIVLRDSAGVLRAFFNVCRHRGTRLCQEPTGRLSETIQCPYHAWTYTTDGRLIGAPHMQDVADFDKRDHGLHVAGIVEWEGLLFVNIAQNPEPFEEYFAPMMDRLARFNLRSLTVGHRVQYDVHANWKLVFQNYSECLHCPMIHPELSVVLPYQSGANDLTEGPFLGGYMEITAPHESATISGRACGRLLGPDVLAGGRRRAYYYTLLPNLLLSLHPDYVNYYLVQPISADRTLVESEWLFHPDTLAHPESSNINDAIQFWDVTNRQDWDIIERSQQGVRSRRYTPGPYSPRESVPAAWDREYRRLMA